MIFSGVSKGGSQTHKLKSIFLLNFSLSFPHYQFPHLHFSRDSVTKLISLFIQLKTISIFFFSFIAIIEETEVTKVPPCKNYLSIDPQHFFAVPLAVPFFHSIHVLVFRSYTEYWLWSVLLRCLLELLFIEIGVYLHG